MPRVHLSPEQRAALGAFCAAGGSITQAAERFGVSTQTVARILREQGISLPMGRRPSRALNHAAFDALTPESLYWMGFVFTDGSIQQDAYGAPFLALNLSAKDRGHLERLRDFLGSAHAIVDGRARQHTVRQTGQQIDSGPSVYFKVRSQQLVDALWNRGMAWHKKDRAPIEALAGSRDFWRGVIDADGTIGVVNDRYPALSLCGHRPMLTVFHDFLVQHGVTDLALTPTTSGILRIGTSGAPARRALHLLYDPPAIALERKIRRAREILETYR